MGLVLILLVMLFLIAATLWLCCQSVLAAIVNSLLDAIRQPARTLPALFPLEQSVQETGESPLGHGTLVGTLQPIAVQDMLPVIGRQESLFQRNLPTLRVTFIEVLNILFTTLFCKCLFMQIPVVKRLAEYP